MPEGRVINDKIVFETIEGEVLQKLMEVLPLQTILLTRFHKNNLMI